MLPSAISSLLFSSPQTQDYSNILIRLLKGVLCLVLFMVGATIVIFGFILIVANKGFE
jgi:hypothetical protein